MQPEQQAERAKPSPAPAGGGAQGVGTRFARQPIQLTFSVTLMVIGAVVGEKVADWYVHWIVSRHLWDDPPRLAMTAALVVIGMLCGFLFASLTFRQIVEVVPKIESLPLEDKIAGLIGVILGLIVAVLLSPLASTVATYGDVLVALIYVFAVFLGVLFTISMKKELMGMFRSSAKEAEEEPAPTATAVRVKLLDTNVIIDGRLLDVWNTGFIEGPLLLPQFVLDELQKIADSTDDLKRARGRRGLDLLGRIREEVTTFRVLRPSDYPVSVDDIDGVDQKLIRLAAQMDAVLVTNDYNLNRVADVHGIPVLNLNRLAMALKPVVLAGEVLTVNIIRPGRDPGQGVAYLDDGTMVVVEDGEPKVGRVVDVVVTSLLQTVQGKMIFAVLKDGEQAHGRGGR